MEMNSALLKALHRKLSIISQVKEEDVSKATEMTEEQFEKAVESQKLLVFTDDGLNKFLTDLRKGMHENKLSKEDIEKAGKDLGKLHKVTKTDKNGKRTTVWVANPEPEKPKGTGKRNPPEYAGFSEKKQKQQDKSDEKERDRIDITKQTASSPKAQAEAKSYKMDDKVSVGGKKGTLMSPVGAKGKALVKFEGGGEKWVHTDEMKKQGGATSEKKESTPKKTEKTSTESGKFTHDGRNFLVTGSKGDFNVLIRDKTGTKTLGSYSTKSATKEEAFDEVKKEADAYFSKKPASKTEEKPTEKKESRRDVRERKVAENTGTYDEAVEGLKEKQAAAQAKIAKMAELKKKMGITKAIETKPVISNANEALELLLNQ